MIKSPVVQALATSACEGISGLHVLLLAKVSKWKDQERQPTFQNHHLAELSRERRETVTAAREGLKTASDLPTFRPDTASGRAARSHGETIARITVGRRGVCFR
ncbi:MAG: hypothetical protein N2C14_10450 [Planctomycetales bacterium]